MDDFSARIKATLARLSADSGLDLVLETTTCEVCQETIYCIKVDGHPGGIYLPHSNKKKLRKVLEQLGVSLLRQAITYNAFSSEVHSSLKVNLDTEVPTMVLLVTPKNGFKGFHQKSIHESVYG